jgi:hypothetical protein
MKKRIVIPIVVVSLIMVIFAMYKMKALQPDVGSAPFSYNWVSSSPAPCSSKNCIDTGSQTVDVKCFKGDTQVDDSFCKDTKPPTTQACINKTLGGEECPYWKKIDNVIPCPSTCIDASINVGVQYACSTGNNANCNQVAYDPQTNLTGKRVNDCMVSKMCKTVAVSLSGVSNTTPIGNNADLGFVKILDNVLLMPKNTANGYFMICIAWCGTTSANINLPLKNYTNIRFATEANMNINSSGSRCSTAMFMYYFQIIDSSLDATIPLQDAAFSLPANLSQTTLILAQISNYSLPPTVIDPNIPKVSRFTFLNQTNSLPLRNPVAKINQFDIQILNNVITIPKVVDKPFLFLLMWYSDVQTNNNLLPLIMHSQNLSTQGPYFTENGLTYNMLCTGTGTLFYITVLKISDKSRDATISVSNTGSIPNKGGNLYMIELNL